VLCKVHGERIAIHQVSYARLVETTKGQTNRPIATAKIQELAPLAEEFCCMIELGVLERLEQMHGPDIDLVAAKERLRNAQTEPGPAVERKVYSFLQVCI